MKEVPIHWIGKHPKYRYPTNEAAHVARAELEVDGVLASDVRPHVYQCGGCGDWHLGHMRIGGKKRFVRHEAVPA